jgi:hypothetical protein
MDKLRPIISQTAGLIVSWIAGYVLVHYAFTLTRDQIETGTKLVDGVITLLATFVYTHLAVAVKTNPSNAASPGAARQGKYEQDERKAYRAMRRRTNELDIPPRAS